MKKFKLIIASLAFVVLSVAAFAMPQETVSAVNALEGACNASSGNASNPVCTASADDAPSLVKTIINILLFVVGALAVVMLIWGGIMFTTSTGDSGRVKKAKDTILYSIIGIIVAFLAFAVINWVFDLF